MKGREGALSFYYFAANYPRFRSVAYVSIAPSRKRGFCLPYQQPAQEPLRNSKEGLNGSYSFAER